MSERKGAWLVAVALLACTGVGYAAGRASGVSGARFAEAAGDMVMPAADGLRTRDRRSAIRAETESWVERQRSDYARDSVFTDVDLGRGRGLFVVEDQVADVYRHNYGRRISTWTAVVRHRDSPIGESCAVALNREPAYLNGVPLYREGRVRCSWDLATRFNRWRQ